MVDSVSSHFTRTITTLLQSELVIFRWVVDSFLWSVYDLERQKLVVIVRAETACRANKNRVKQNMYRHPMPVNSKCCRAAESEIIIGFWYDVRTFGGLVIRLFIYWTRYNIWTPEYCYWPVSCAYPVVSHMKIQPTIYFDGKSDIEVVQKIHVAPYQK